MKNNVLLIGVVEKCCPDEARMKCQILEKLKLSNFEEALRVANEGLELCKADLPHDHSWQTRHVLYDKSPGELLLIYIMCSRGNRQQCVKPSVYSLHLNIWF